MFKQSRVCYEHAMILSKALKIIYNSDIDNNNFRQTVTRYTDIDVLALCETFLRDNEEINVDGYKFIGHNRTKLHKNAKRGYSN